MFASLRVILVLSNGSTRFGADHYVTLASGSEPIDGDVLTQFDPTVLTNGFYQLRLSTTDISDRTSTTGSSVYVVVDNSIRKAS